MSVERTHKDPKPINTDLNFLNRFSFWHENTEPLSLCDHKIRARNSSCTLASSC